MLFYQNFIIVVLLACSVYACYTDFKYKKIKNVVSLGLVGFGVFNHVVYFVIGGMEAKENLTASITVVLIGCLIGAVLYVFGLWSAGDAKLFWGFSAAAPPMLFRTIQGSGNMLPVVMIENVFLVYLIFMLPYLLLRTSWEEKKIVFIENIKSVDSLGGSLKRVLFDLPFFLLLIYGISSLTRRGLNFSINPVVLGIFSIMLVIAFDKFAVRRGLEKYKNFIFAPACLFTILLMPVLRHQYFTLAPILFFIVFLFRPFIWRLGERICVKEINLNDLRAGVIPAERIFQVVTSNEETRYEKEPAILPKRRNEKVILDVSTKGISQSKVDEIQELWRNGTFQHLNDTIKIQQHISLAGVICLGCLLAIFCKTTLITYLRYLYVITFT